MAIPFPRSTRSLAADGFRYTLLGLAIAILLLIAWGGWFFGATVTLYESSEQARLNLIDGEIIQVEFSKEQLANIKRGQRARFFPDGETIALTAVVTDVYQPQQNSNQSSALGQVSLILIDERRIPISLDHNTQGRVEIETEHLVPAQLLLRSAGSQTSSNSLSKAE